METCADCERGPAGIAGHEGLFSQTMRPAEMHFKCRGCGRAWARHSAGEGAFRWEEIKEPFGMGVPGKPGTAPP